MDKLDCCKGCAVAVSVSYEFLLARWFFYFNGGLLLTNWKSFNYFQSTVSGGLLPVIWYDKIYIILYCTQYRRVKIYFISHYPMRDLASLTGRKFRDMMASLSDFLSNLQYGLLNINYFTFIYQVCLSIII